MASFLRIFQHLLPRNQGWSLTPGKRLRSFFEGLTGVFEDAKSYADLAYLDLFPSSTRFLREWEEQYGLTPNGDEAARRLALAAEWKATGGQSPAYAQEVLRTAGFDVYVHEWFQDDTTTVSPTLDCAREGAPTITVSGAAADATDLVLRPYVQDGWLFAELFAGGISQPTIEYIAPPPAVKNVGVMGFPGATTFTFSGTLDDYRVEGDIYRAQLVPSVTRDPRGYTNVPLTGTVQCDSDVDTQFQCGDVEAQCNTLLANDPKYLVNGDLTRQAPPPIPSDPSTWVHFWYVSGETFGEPALVPNARRAEFERLIYKLKPAQTWVVEDVTWAYSLVTDEDGYVYVDSDTGALVLG